MGMENTLMMSEDDETSDDTDSSDVDALFSSHKKAASPKSNRGCVAESPSRITITESIAVFLGAFFVAPSLSQSIAL